MNEIAQGNRSIVIVINSARLSVLWNGVSEGSIHGPCDLT